MYMYIYIYFIYIYKHYIYLWPFRGPPCGMWFWHHFGQGFWELLWRCTLLQMRVHLSLPVNLNLRAKVGADRSPDPGDAHQGMLRSGPCVRPPGAQPASTRANFVVYECARHQTK